MLGPKIINPKTPTIREGTNGEDPALLPAIALASGDLEYHGQFTNHLYRFKRSMNQVTN